MAQKNVQDNQPTNAQTLTNPRRILQTIYGSRARRISRQLSPINTSANMKNSSVITASSDYYTFQRALARMNNNIPLNPEKKPDNFRKTFSISKPSRQPRSIASSNSRTKLVNLPPPASPRAVSNYPQSSRASAVKLAMNNTTGFNKSNSAQKPATQRSNLLSSTAQNFRPPTQNFLRHNNEAQDHNNYLTKYQIVKQLGKGTYGVVHLARKKGEKIKIHSKIQSLEDSFMFSFGTLKKQVGGDYDKSRQASKQGRMVQSPKKQENLDQNTCNNQERGQDSQLIKQISHKSQNGEQQLAQNTENKKVNHLKVTVPLIPLNSTTPLLVVTRQNKPQSKELKQEQLFAIKIYEKFKMNKDPTKFKNIRKEINIMQNIQHPHIIKLYETVQTLTKISLVVQYGGNQSLLQYLKQNFPLSQNQMRKIGNQLISALRYLHDKNIVHRDIKLQNILMLNGDVKMIDFGFSTLTYKNRKLNAICGTPNYMAPEVLSKKQYIGQLADVWSYGVVMFTIAEGRHPFKADTYNQLERLVNKGIYQFKRITNPIHQAFIKRILKIKPQDRPRAADLSNHPWLIMKDDQNGEQARK